MTRPLQLLDTNVLLLLARGGPAGRWIEREHGLSAAPERPLISVVTKGEVLSFALKRGWDSQKLSKLDSLLRSLVVVDISSDEVLRAYAEIDVFSDSVARSMKGMKNDLWIAATARATAAVLLTTDSDFDHLDPIHLKRIWIDPAKLPRR